MEDHVEPGTRCLPEYAYEPRRFPPGCKGYDNGCICTRCKKRTKRRPSEDEVRCECERPLAFDGTCFKCSQRLR